MPRKDAEEYMPPEVLPGQLPLWPEEDEALRLLQNLPSVGDVLATLPSVEDVLASLPTLEELVTNASTKERHD